MKQANKKSTKESVWRVGWMPWERTRISTFSEPNVTVHVEY